MPQTGCDNSFKIHAYILFRVLRVSLTVLPLPLVITSTDSHSISQVVIQAWGEYVEYLDDVINLVHQAPLE